MASDDKLKALQKRLDALEAMAAQLDAMGESGTQHSDRWWATYNAVLPEAMRKVMYKEDAHDIARAYADLAHGPLQAAAGRSSEST